MQVYCIWILTLNENMQHFSKKNVYISLQLFMPYLCVCIKYDNECIIMIIMYSWIYETVHVL